MTPEDEARKLALLNSPHVRPLMEMIRAWERRFPSIDPEDGGVNARVLFLQHTPGRMAVRSGFVSRDNSDRTAQNVSTALDYAGFNRTDYVRWNVVPYYISTKEKDGKASASDVRDAAPYTQAFIGQLPKLRVAVFCGESAKKQRKYLKLPASINQLCTFHCGAQSYDAFPDQQKHILATFKEAYDLMKVG